MLDNAKLIDQSLIGTFQYFGLQEKQIDEAKYYLIHTECNHPLWNMIVLPDIVTADQMNKMEEIFKMQKLPFAWWVDEKNLSSEMLKHFKNGNYTSFGNVPGMVFELKNYHDQLDNQEVKVITEVEEFKKWIQALAQGFGFSNDVCDVYFNKLSKYIGNSKTFIPLAAYDGDKIIATASIIFANGIAGFYNGSTLPEYRNRGISSSLYKARFKILKEMGIDKAVIQTSPMSTNLAQKLDFKKYTNYKIYCQIKN
ncbi:MAG: GNAT family N-acetyltransferase [Rickettsia endosymbiont of Stiretrus anchorago]|nr:GNAT family N-acetyltransferase [Rickettsia endosymbiont of Stiretrus anchorago]